MSLIAVFFGNSVSRFEMESLDGVVLMPTSKLHDIATRCEFTQNTHLPPKLDVLKTKT